MGKRSIIGRDASWGSPVPVATAIAIPREPPIVRFQLLFLLILFLVPQLFAQDMPPEGGLGDAPENPIRVTGTVSAPTGPAEGVTVLLELSDMRIKRQIAYFDTKTDPQGYFEFDLGEHDMPAYGLQFNTLSPRYMEALKIIEATRAEMPVHVDLMVEPGLLARGTVYDAEGNPLEGVSVSGVRLRPKKSDEEGKWEIFGLYPSGQQLRFQKEGYADQFHDVVSYEAGIVEGIEIVMESARELRGRVIDWGKNPVSGAIVVLQGAGRYQQEQATGSGEFLFRGVPEDLTTLEIQVMAAGYLPTAREFTKEESDAQFVEITIDHGVFVEGIVSLPSGSPAAGAMVTSGRSLGSASPRSLVDANGNWRLGPFVPGSEVTFTVLPPNMESTWAIADLSLRQAGSPTSYEGVVELWPKEFSSTFTAASNEANFTMTRRDSGTGGFPGPIEYVGKIEPGGQTAVGTAEVMALEQEGKFEMRRISAPMGVDVSVSLAGEWELREEFRPSRLAVAPVQQSIILPLVTGTTQLDFQMDESLILRGTAIQANGKPFLDGQVVLYEWNNTSVYEPVAEIGIAGRFEFTRVPKGTFIVVATSADQEHQTTPRVLRGGLEGVELREEDSTEDPMDD